MEGEVSDYQQWHEEERSGANASSEGKDVILFSWLPSPIPFFICANFVFLDLLPVFVREFEKGGRESEGDRRAVDFLTRVRAGGAKYGPGKRK